jgi:hypothetical protein
LILLVPPARFERAAPGLGILRSIQLSYGGDGEGTSFTIAGFIAELSPNNKIGFIRFVDSRYHFSGNKYCFYSNKKRLPERGSLLKKVKTYNFITFSSDDMRHTW